MANSLYDLGRDAFLKGDIDWDADTFRIALLDSSYSPTLATDEFYDEVTAAEVSTASLDNTTTPLANGVADADDVVFSSVTGDDVYYIAIYKFTGDEATSPLVGLIDTATGLPLLSPSGVQVTVTWAATANRIFKL